MQGGVLTANHSLADADGLGEVGFTWQVSPDGNTHWRDISNATESTLTLTQAEVGQFVRAVATYTDGNSVLERVESLATESAVVESSADAQGLSVLGSAIVMNEDEPYTLTEDAFGIGNGGDNSLTRVKLLNLSQEGQGHLELNGGVLNAGAEVSLSDLSAGALVYVPKANSHGESNPPLSLFFLVGDADAFSQQPHQVTIDITPVNDMPVAINGSFALMEDTPMPGLDGLDLEGLLGGLPDLGGGFPGLGGGLPDLSGGLPDLGGILPDLGNLDLSGLLGDLEVTGYLKAEDLEGDALSFQIVDSTTDGTVVITDALTGAFTYKPDLTFGDSDQFTFRVSDGVSVSNVATVTIQSSNTPFSGTVTVDGTVAQNSVLTANNSLVDADGLGPMSYKWQASPNGMNWRSIYGATDRTFTPTQAEVGQFLRVEASYIDQKGTHESVKSATTVAVADVNDSPIGFVLLDGVVAQNGVLTVAQTLVDADGLGPLNYQWQVSADGSTDWTDIANATDSTLTLTQAEVGQYLQAVVSYTDSLGTAESVAGVATVVVANVNDLPTGDVTIDGTVEEGSVLTVSDMLDDVDGLGAISYQWQVSPDGSTDWTDIADATASTLTLTQAEVGQSIQVVARYTDGQGTLERVASAATVAVVGVNDLPTGDVTIDGTVEEGSVLTVSDTLDDVDGLGTISYQWQVSPDGSSDWMDITDATASTLALTQAEVGQSIQVVARYTDGQGTLERVASAATVAVVGVNDLPTGDVTIDGTVEEGSVLTVSDTLDDVDGLGTVGYQWQISSDGSTDWTDLADATASTLMLTQAEVGQFIQVVASYTDGQGTLERVASPATVAVAGVASGAHAPLGTDGMAIVPEDLPYSFTEASFGFNGIDGGDSLAQVKIVDLPQTGLLVLQGMALTGETVVDISAIHAGQLLYVPEENGSGANYDSFSFHVGDDALFSEQPNLMTVHVAALNDAPIAQDDALLLSELDSEMTGYLSADDVEGDLLSFQLVQTTAYGSVVLTDAETGAFTYTPDTTFSDTDQFTFIASDGSLVSNVATVTIQLQPDEIVEDVSSPRILTAPSARFSQVKADTRPEEETLSQGSDSVNQDFVFDFHSMALGHATGEVEGFDHRNGVETESSEEEDSGLSFDFSAADPDTSDAGEVNGMGNFSGYGVVPPATVSLTWDNVFLPVGEEMQETAQVITAWSESWDAIMPDGDHATIPEEESTTPSWFLEAQQDSTALV